MSCLSTVSFQYDLSFLSILLPSCHQTTLMSLPACYGIEHFIFLQRDFPFKNNQGQEAGPLLRDEQMPKRVVLFLAPSFMAITYPRLMYELLSVPVATQDQLGIYRDGPNTPLMTEESFILDSVCTVKETPF